MKPCSKNRKLIAWLAVDALDPRRARALREHLAICPSCRAYLQEISRVTETLARADASARGDVQASTAFHQKVLHAIRTEATDSGWETLRAWLRSTMLNWRVALPVAGAGLLAIAALSFLRPEPVARPSAPTGAETRWAVVGHELDLPPTVSNYQLVANRSLEELDQLLTRQGRRNPSAAPVYTASTLIAPDATEQ